MHATSKKQIQLLGFSSILKMEAGSSAETSVNVQQTSWGRSPAEHQIQLQICTLQQED
jgi:hypothetical protein